MEFGFFKNNSTSSFMDGENKYTNIFKVMYDTFIYGLRKVGISNITIIAGQMGWPTDDAEGANIRNTDRLFKGFVEHFIEGKGTLLHPGPIDTYIYNLIDKNKLKTRCGDFIRHWGIYKIDGIPKYNIDFTNQNREIQLVTVKEIPSLPKRWCIFNNRTKDSSEINM